MIKSSDIDLVPFCFWKMVTDGLPGFGWQGEEYDDLGLMVLYPKESIQLRNQFTVNCKDCEFISHRGQSCLCLLTVEFCQIEISGTGRSPFVKCYTALLCVRVCVCVCV
jgi:hypothetical protein